MDDDRSFLYGDGLFETVRVEKGQVRFLDHHRARLRRSASVLGFAEGRVEEACRLLGAPAGLDGLWRVTISRDGEGVAFGGSGRVSARWRGGLPELSAPRLVTMQGFYFPGDALAEHKTTSWLRSVELRRRAQDRKSTR